MDQNGVYVSFGELLDVLKEADTHHTFCVTINL